MQVQVGHTLVWIAKAVDVTNLNVYRLQELTRVGAFSEDPDSCPRIHRSDPSGTINRSIPRAQNRGPVGQHLRYLSLGQEEETKNGIRR